MFKFCGFFFTENTWILILVENSSQPIYWCSVNSHFGICMGAGPIWKITDSCKQLAYVSCYLSNTANSLIFFLLITIINSSIYNISTGSVTSDNEHNKDNSYKFLINQIQNWGKHTCYNFHRYIWLLINVHLF